MSRHHLLSLLFFFSFFNGNCHRRWPCRATTIASSNPFSPSFLLSLIRLKTIHPMPPIEKQFTSPTTHPIDPSSLLIDNNNKIIKIINNTSRLNRIVESDVKLRGCWYDKDVTNRVQAQSPHVRTITTQSVMTMVVISVGEGKERKKWNKVMTWWWDVNDKRWWDVNDKTW